MISPMVGHGIAKGLAHRTLAAATAEELRRRILTGSFPAGYQLRQDALASEFGIIPHRGAVVSEMSIGEIVA